MTIVHSVTMRARKQDFVRNAIWDTAMDLFAAKGYDQTTVEEIARAAGVSRRSFFRYFSSKDDLMGQAIVSYGAALQKEIEACPATCPLLEVVRRTVLGIAVEAAGHPQTRKVIQISDSNPAARAAQVSRWAELEHTVAHAFALRDKRCSPLTVRLAAALTLSTLDVTFRVWFESADEEISQVVEEVFGKLTTLVCPGSRAK